MTQPVEVVGARELRRALKQVEGGIDDLKKAGKKAADLVGDEAVKRAPKRTGRLAGSVRGAGQASGAVVRAGFASVPWAGPIHFGWASRPNSAKGWRGGPISPQPFLYDALDAQREEVLDVYNKQVNDVIADANL